MGVIKDDHLMITQAMPEITKQMIRELMEAVEKES